jgi:hypothetical protein
MAGHKFTDQGVEGRGRLDTALSFLGMAFSFLGMAFSFFVMARPVRASYRGTCGDRWPGHAWP